MKRAMLSISVVLILACGGAGFEPYPGSPAPQPIPSLRDWPVFYEAFREAAHAGDHDSLAAMTRFPLLTEGPYDFKTKVAYTRDLFPVVMPMLLQEPSFLAPSITALEGLTPGAEMESEARTGVHNLSFAYEDGRWLLVRVRVQDDFYDRARAAGLPSPPQ